MIEYVNSHGRVCGLNPAHVIRFVCYDSSVMVILRGGERLMIEMEPQGFLDAIREVAATVRS